LFEKVLRKSQDWGNSSNMMYVVGATKADMLAEIRKIVPDHFLLVPGVGAQGGSLEDVVKYGMNKDCGLLVNASRSILYASNENDFLEKARAEAQSMRDAMAVFL
jgi:orotidine-5'-phosphate decarboxylase